MKQTSHHQFTGTSIRSTTGFTLVELMITLAISTLIVAALYSTYILQQRSYTNQSVVAEMQQNLRAGMDFLVLDMRMAGYDPNETANATITAANATNFAFNADIDRDGSVAVAATQNEHFRYQLGISNAGGVNTPALMRSATSDGTLSLQPMADYIENVEFYYWLKNGTKTLTPGAGDLDNIRSVQVSMLARAAQPDRKYTNNTAYTTASGAIWPAANDNFRRRLLLTHIDLRNMGL